MAGMTLPLTVFSENGNTRTSTRNNHTVSKPELVIEKRRVPENGVIVAEYSAKVVEGTVDAAGAQLVQKVTFECVVRYPINGVIADRNAALAYFRDIIASDDFANSIETQEWL